MTELIRELRARVEARVKTVAVVNGDDDRAVRMAFLILADAEEIDRQLGERRVSTAEASERTGWTPETLQKYARAKLAGDDMPVEWAGLIVEQVSGAYVFVVGTIPQKSSRAA